MSPLSVLKRVQNMAHMGLPEPCNFVTCSLCRPGCLATTGYPHAGGWHGSTGGAGQDAEHGPHEAH